MKPKPKKSFRLLWEYGGAIRGQHFDQWEDLEAFSQRLIDAGLCPWGQWATDLAVAQNLDQPGALRPRHW
jgi:hypothetical protein